MRRRLLFVLGFVTVVDLASSCGYPLSTRDDRSKVLKLVSAPVCHTMSLSGRTIKLPLLIIIGVLGSTGLVQVGMVSGSTHYAIIADLVATGSGSAGSGSLAGAWHFNLRLDSGAGAFSGAVAGVQASGLFSLTVSNPAGTPILPCPMGEVSVGGSVIDGSFLGEKVLVASCVGSGVPGAFVVYHVCLLSGCPDPDFSGRGTGTGTVSSKSIKAGFVAAGVTTGSGSGGAGALYTAEADVVTTDGGFFGGGAFVGTISENLIGNGFSTLSASVQPGCTLTTSGVTASWGSFPNQPASSSYTPTTCPPTSSGPQTARFVYAIGGEVSTVYKGTGSATEKIQTVGQA